MATSRNPSRCESIPEEEYAMSSDSIENILAHFIMSISSSATIRLQSAPDGREWIANIRGVDVVRVEPGGRVTLLQGRGSILVDALQNLWNLMSCVPDGGYLLIEQGRYDEIRKRWEMSDWRIIDR